MSKYFNLSGNIEKYFGLGLWIVFYGFLFLIMKGYDGFLRFLKLLFKKSVGVNSGSETIRSILEYETNSEQR